MINNELASDDEMSFSANGRPNPLNDDDLSDLTKKEILYWSHKLELTPSELFALSTSELEHHLNYAYTDALQEQSHQVRSQDWKEFSDMKRKLREYKHEERLKGGATPIYQNIWAILAQAAMEIDKLCNGGGGGESNKMKEGFSIKKNLQNIFRNSLASRETSSRDSSPLANNQNLQSFVRSNSIPRPSSGRSDVQPIQRRTSLPRRGHAPRYPAVAQNQPQTITPSSPSSLQDCPDTDNSYTSGYASAMQQVFGTSCPTKEQVISAQGYPLQDRQSSQGSYSTQNAVSYGNVVIPINRLSSGSHAPNAGTPSSQQAYRTSSPRLHSHGTTTQSKLPLNQTNYITVSPTQRSPNGNISSTRNHEIIGDRIYNYDNIALMQQQSRDGIPSRAGAMYPATIATAHSPNPLRQQPYASNKILRSKQLLTRSSNDCVAPTSSKRSSPRRTSSEECNCNPAPQVITMHPASPQSKSETRSCPPSASTSPSVSCSALPLHSCLKRSDSASRRSSRSITFDPRFCPDISPPGTRSTSQTYVQSTSEVDVEPSEQKLRISGGQCHYQHSASQPTYQTYYMSAENPNEEQYFHQRPRKFSARSSPKTSFAQNLEPEDDKKPPAGSVKNLTDYWYEVDPDGCKENSESITIEFLEGERKRVIASSQNNHIPGGNAEKYLQKNPLKCKSCPTTAKPKRKKTFIDPFDIDGGM